VHALNLIAYFDELLDIDIPIKVTKENSGYLISRIESRLEVIECRFTVLGRFFVPSEEDFQFVKIYLEKKQAVLQGQAILKLHSKDPEIDLMYDRITKALSQGAIGSGKVTCRINMNGQFYESKEIEKNIFYYDY